MNRTPAGVDTLITKQGPTYQHITDNFMTVSAGLYPLSLVVLNTSGSTNDFAIDDITVTSAAGGGVIINNGALQATGER